MFKVGDTVRCRGGGRTYRIERTLPVALDIRSEPGVLYTVKPDQMVHVNEPYEKPKEEKMKLYQITHNDKTLYGHKLAVNSAGQWVMEVKGTSEVLAVSPDCLEEVIPHSISVKFFWKDTEYHYLAPKDKYTVGQTFVYDSKLGYGPSFVMVTKVDTRSTNATKEFEPIIEVFTKHIDK